ncbi:peptidoglycan DD-metalloendopeptidase family protein [uncultured Aquimarina sp.]|uniref:peptidoglycan DD-metalloendopeptidase family protein n=1 Tax=uncultured Aquimarina sp. TaxID=575652 RepID=UPI002636D105|nr:peptidoglycan DD-metalloendopeptidase family protein [uncultured Aquimarina sp.]
MKNITLKALLALLLYASLTNAQELILRKNQQLFTQNIEDQDQRLLNRKKSSLHITSKIDNIVQDIKYISNDVKASPNFDFFQGLQSPHNPVIWIYLEREQIGGAFNLRKVNLKNKQLTTLQSKTNENRKDIALKPIAWSKNPNQIFVEGIYLDAAEEHEGIFIYDIQTNNLRKLVLPFQYKSTPLLSPQRDHFIFSGSNEKKLDYLHGISDIIYEYHIDTKQSKTITSSPGNHMEILGWNINSKNSKDTSANQKSALSYYLPWDFGKENCVSRHGTPGPTGSHSPVGQCGFFTPGGHHGYQAIDFATSLSGDDNVRASAAGTISFSGISGSLSSGYGRLVIVRHSDGTRTYYAHNKTLLVSQGQSVQKGQVIALEGTTGGSTGDHIHFEWRAAGGNSPTPGSFVDAGQPRQNYIYRSQNSFGSSADTQAPTTSISAVGGTTQSGDFIANFNDNDNVGVTRRFYQALEKYGSNWYANRGNGFFNDNFNIFYSGYTKGAGDWEINNGHLRQSNTSSDNTKLNTFLSQNSELPYLYEFSAKTISTNGPRKFGIHIMADTPDQSQRGNSYLIWFSGEDNKVRIYETINNQLNFRAIDDVPLDNKWANYKITYSPGFGVIEVFRNNTSILKWTDPSPIKNGSTISLRTNKTSVEFDDLKVYKFRADASTTVSAGSSVSKDIRRRNGKIKSLVKDAAGNWSSPGNLDITISSLTRQNTSIQDDTFIDNHIEVYPNPTKGTDLTLSYSSFATSYTAISITDITGRTIKSFREYTKEAGNQSIDLSNYFTSIQNGQYFIKVSNDRGSKVISVIKN